MKLRSSKMTCSACPSQWDAVTEDGDEVYIRYRHGHLTVSDFPGGKNIISMPWGGAGMGVMSTEEMEEAIA